MASVSPINGKPSYRSWISVSFLAFHRLSHVQPSLPSCLGYCGFSNDNRVTPSSQSESEGAEGGERMAKEKSGREGTG